MKFYLFFCILLLSLTGLYYFYFFENFDSKMLKTEAFQAIVQQDKIYFLKDFFTDNWDTVCPVHSETIEPDYPAEMKKHVDSKYYDLLPNTYAYNYNFYLIFLFKDVPIKVIKVKNPRLKYNNIEYYLTMPDKLKCFQRNKAKFIIYENNKIHNVIIGE